MSRNKDDDRYAALRGAPDPTMGNFIRWERIKLWDAVQDTLALIEERAPAIPDEAEALWDDPEFSQMVQAMRDRRERLGELRRLQQEAEMEVAPGPPLPDE